jgi:peptide deformylase
MIIRKSDLKLVKTDSEVLLTQPEPYVFDAEDSNPEMFANMMIDRMKELGGIGLSANQVGVNARMFVMGVNDVTYAVFNPEIVNASQDVISSDEGCLSYPGVYMKVSRPASVVVKYQNVKGETIQEEFHGLTARIFLHEYDHMEGKTFKDKVSKMKWDLAYNRMIKRTKKIIRHGVQKQLQNIKKQMEATN